MSKIRRIRHLCTWQPKGGHADIVGLLIKHTTNADVNDEYGRKSLHKAAENGHTKVIELLMKDILVDVI